MTGAPAGRWALEERPIPESGPGEVLVRVAACGACRTDLHVVDGALARPRLPLGPGHEAVGRVTALGAGAWASASASPGSAGPVVPAASA